MHEQPVLVGAPSPPVVKANAARALRRDGVKKLDPSLHPEPRKADRGRNAGGAIPKGDGSSKRDEKKTEPGAKPSGPHMRPIGSSKQSFECADLSLLGRIIRWIRKNRVEGGPISQTELAERMCGASGRPVDQATVSRIESGDRAMSLPTFNALSQAVEIPGNCLLILAIREFGDDAHLEGLIRQIQDEISKKYLGRSFMKLILDLPPI